MRVRAIERTDSTKLSPGLHMGTVAWTYHTYVMSRIHTLMMMIDKNCEISEVGNYKNILVGRGGAHLQAQNSEG